MQRFKKALSTFYKSIWFFPTLLFIIVIVLSALHVNGSSIGTYHQVFYGNSAKDPDLIINKSRDIRSDEWLVTTQLSIAQTKINLSAVNPNIGDGEDVSLLVDAPTTDLLQVFKPHNLGFFFLPIDVAFAMKWWLLAYFLVVSVYFFVLAIMPKKKLLAIIISLAFAASPFIMWWYQYITLAPIYYALFMLVVVIKMIHSQSIRRSLLWGVILAYLATSFAIILYPPFQIPCALAVLAFIVGYYFDNRIKTWESNKPLVFGGILAVTLTTIFLALCIIPKLNLIETIMATAYPGQRTVPSGNMNIGLFTASNVSIITQLNSHAKNYGWLGNQSEGANFLLVFIFLAPVLIYFAAKYRRKINNKYTMLCVAIVSLIFLAWMFVPHIDWLGKITLLSSIPQARLLIGFGLVNLFLLIFFIQIYSKKDIKLPKYTPLIYSLIILALYLLLDFYIHQLFPDFISIKWAILLALPYPVIIYLLLTHRTKLAVVTLLVFSIGSVALIHPLYRGVKVLTESKLSQAIRSVDPSNSKKWVTDSLILENLPAMNGKKSLSGTYVYPQNQLWEKEFPNDRNMYNRYAHVHFIFDRNANVTIQPKLTQPGPDQLSPVLEPCDNFLRENNVGYIMTATAFTRKDAACANLIKIVSYPTINIYIYSLKF